MRTEDKGFKTVQSLQRIVEHDYTSEHLVESIGSGL